MIRMIGNHICKDCVAACAQIEREHLPIEFHDMEKSLDYVKEFLAVREGNPELFEECRKENQIGIPVFVLDDGKVTLDCDEAFAAARKEKASTVVMIGSSLCPGCRARMQQIREEGLCAEIHDLTENLNDMRLFLKIREGNPELYDAVRAEGKVGIPVFVLPDGTVTVEWEKALEEMKKLK